jgi:hypothetical protein
MKKLTVVLAMTVLFSASAFAAKMVSSDEVKSGGYTSLGNISVEQQGTPTVGHKAYSKAANKKCHESGAVKPNQCFYRIVDEAGHKTNHKDIGLEVYKK